MLQVPECFPKCFGTNPQRPSEVSHKCNFACVQGVHVETTDGRIVRVGVINIFVNFNRCDDGCEDEAMNVFRMKHVAGFIAPSGEEDHHDYKGFVVAETVIVKPQEVIQKGNRRGVAAYEDG